MSVSKRIFSTFAALTLLVISATIAAAQVRPPVPRASQKMTIAQTVGTTEIAIIYSRPAVKGRVVYGDWPTVVAGESTLDNQNQRPAGAPLVPWGHIWRAGANEATMFTVADDVTINGQPLAAGSYSFHVIPSKNGEWTLIFNKELDWGSFTYKAAQDALRVKTKAEAAPFNMELLTYYFDPVGDKSATVHLRWEKMDVPFIVEVKDVVGSTMKRLEAYVAGAKADDPTPALNAANYAKANKQADAATKWYDAALKASDEQIKAKASFANLNRRVNILVAAGKTADAIAAGEKAVEAGKTEKVDTAPLEKRIADLKAAKP